MIDFMYHNVPNRPIKSGISCTIMFLTDLLIRVCVIDFMYRNVPNRLTKSGFV